MIDVYMYPWTDYHHLVEYQRRVAALSGDWLPAGYVSIDPLDGTQAMTIPTPDLREWPIWVDVVIVDWSHDLGVSPACRARVDAILREHGDYAYARQMTRECVRTELGVHLR